MTEARELKLNLMPRVWRTLSIGVILLGLLGNDYADGVPRSVGRWEISSHDGFCTLSARAQNASKVSISFMKDRYGASVMLIDGAGAKKIIRKNSTSAVIVDDVALPANNDVSFEPVRILKVSDGRLLHAVRVGRVMTVFIEGRVRAQLSLSGSSDALLALSPCLQSLNAPSESKSSTSSNSPQQLIRSKQKEADTPHTSKLGDMNSCSGIYAYLDTSGIHPMGLSVEVTAKDVNVRFSDNGSLSGRAQTQPDKSVQFNEGGNDPMWKLRCYSNGALLLQPADQWSEDRVYTLERAQAHIFDYAAKKGIDLRH